MTYPDKKGALDDVIAQFALVEGAAQEIESGTRLAHDEVIRQELTAKYHSEVFIPRLAFWSRFNDFFKAQEPAWVNPLIMKPRQLHDRDYEQNLYHDKLHVASWRFEHTSAAEQVKTATTVQGYQVAREYKQPQSLLLDLPKMHLGAFILGRNRAIRDTYLASRIQGINGYTIETTLHSLQTSESKTIFFQGQDDYDTFITIDQLRSAQRTYTNRHMFYGGIGFRTRPAGFRDTFSAPIEVPIELSENFIPKYVPGGATDLEGTFTDYAYLFETTPCARFKGNVSQAGDLFEYRGNETLAYMQAQSLLKHLHTAAPLTH